MAEAAAPAEADAAAAPEAQATVPLNAAESVLLLVVLPLCNLTAFMWIYTAIPLHFLDSDWPVSQLSLLLTLCYAPRFIMVLSVRYFGDWACSPICGAAAVVNIWMLLQPGELLAVWLGVSAVSIGMSTIAYRSFVHKRFMSAGAWQTARASRIYTLCDTLGYASAPFIGGVLYDTPMRLRACTVYAICASTACCVLPVLVGPCRHSFAETRCVRRLRLSASSSADESRDAADDDCNVATSATTTTNTTAAAAAATAGPPTSLLDARWRAPVLAIFCASFANVLVYGVEWFLYALYFRTTYGWSGSAMGLAQMVGDVLGAGVLAASTLGCTQRRVQRCGAASPRLTAPLAVLGRAPWNVPALFCLHALLFVLLAQPLFVVSLLGQVLLGTVYVLNEQAIQELVLLYAGPSHARYRRLLFVQQLCFQSGCSLNAALAYGLYAAGGFSGAFYGTAALSTAIAFAFAAVFARRLAGTSVGLRGTLAAAEAELAARGAWAISCSEGGPEEPEDVTVVRT